MSALVGLDGVWPTAESFADLAAWKRDPPGRSLSGTRGWQGPGVGWTWCEW